MVKSELELLKKSKEGDIEAFEQLISAYQKKVFNIALRMIGNHDDASDLAQEVFLKVYKSIKQFKEESSFSTWIYRITSNVCLDEVRKLKNKKIISLDEEIKQGENEIKRQIKDIRPSPEDFTEQNELRKAINDAIMTLPEDQGVAIILRDIQGFSYEEIANITKCPIGTIKSRINRARKDLKEIILKKKELFDVDFVK